MDIDTYPSRQLWRAQLRGGPSRTTRADGATLLCLMLAALARQTTFVICARLGDSWEMAAAKPVRRRGRCYGLMLVQPAAMPLDEQRPSTVVMGCQPFYRVVSLDLASQVPGATTTS